MSDEVAMQFEKCRHFNGIHHKTCEAGVEYVPLRDISGPGMAVWPCLQLVGRRVCTTVCEKRELMTDEDHAKEREGINRAANEYLSLLGGGACPECGKLIKKRRQVRRCQYAEPCGHRIGQTDDKEEP